MADNRVYGSADAGASTPGGAGPMNGKLRLMTTQLDNVTNQLYSLQTQMTGLSGQINTGGIARGFLTNASSGGLTSGSIYTALASGTTRSFIEIENVSGPTLWFNFGADAVLSQPSFSLAAGATWRSPSNFCPQDKLTIRGSNLVTPNDVTVKSG